MSRRDDESAHRLDRRFEEILARVKPCLLRMPISGESRLCRAWLERLNRAGDQPNLRNQYLHELHKQLRSYSSLRSPFNKMPEDGRLMPLSTCHRLVMSSSCNELTETSQSLCEQKPTWPKPRSRSLRRDASARRSRIPNRRCEAHSSSPRRSSRPEDSSTPTVHFCDQDTRVRDEFGKKVRTLKALKTHQLKELENLTETKKCLHEKAENLAERYEDIKDKQEELARRAEEVLRLVHLKEPNMNPAERAEGEEIKKMSDKVKELHVRLEQLKKKKDANQALLTEKSNEKTEIIFKQSQLDTITSNLTQIGKDIAELIIRAKALQEQVGL